MARETPQFNIKTGADSQLFFSREFTVSDEEGKIAKNVGIVKTEPVVQDSDVFVYPQLTRRTGHSISGQTESIESQELRKGRTKSAPRKGNSSSEGSLDIELSPETYDDIFEAALRNKWKPWTSDEKSDIKFDFKGTINAGEFISNENSENASSDGSNLKTRKLIGAPNSGAIIEVETPSDYEIDELTNGTRDIKYSALAQYGGLEGSDLYQEFQHLAVNTMSLSVSPGQIVTGSFGFMGANNPDMLNEELEEVTGITDDDTFTAAEGKAVNKTLFKVKDGKYVEATAYEGGIKYYAITNDNIVYGLAKNDKDKGRLFANKDAEGNITCKESGATKDWLNELAKKVATDTDQFTAREGFLYINGHRISYGSNLTFDLNNGLKQIFAIFEKGSISTAPLSLDITGTLDAYLIAGETEKLMNLCTRDKDVEVVFCFQDKEEDPDYLYVIQIFRTKFTGNSPSNGSEELTVSLPFTSFGERACRFFRIKKKEIAEKKRGDVIEVTADNGKTESDKFTVAVKIPTVGTLSATQSISVEVTKEGESPVSATGSYTSGRGKYTYAKFEKSGDDPETKNFTVKVTLSDTNTGRSFVTEKVYAITLE